MLPNERGPHAAVIIVGGSGSQDRDGYFQLNHRTFLVLSDRLARIGVAVLRVDERGIGGSEGSIRAEALSDGAADVRGAIDWLAARQDVDASRIGIIGHSEGGLIALTLARDPRIAFLVLLATPTAEMVENIVFQTASAYRQLAMSEAAVASNLSVLRSVVELIRAGTSSGQILADSIRMRAEQITPPAGISKQVFVEQFVRNITAPRQIELARLDAPTLLSQFRGAVLAIYGGKDVQVPASLNSVGATAATRWNSRSRVVVLPDLNHMLQTAMNGSPIEYDGIEETIAESALSELVQWLRIAVIGR